MTMTTTLIATPRNEGPFLLEWVAYHRATRFDRINALLSPEKTRAIMQAQLLKADEDGDRVMQLVNPVHHSEGRSDFGVMVDDLAKDRRPAIAKSIEARIK